jgi:hypothetical protein
LEPVEARRDGQPVIYYHPDLISDLAGKRGAPKLRVAVAVNPNPTSAVRRKWQVSSAAGALQVVGCQQTLPLSGDVVPTYPLEMNGIAWA